MKNDHDSPRCQMCARIGTNLTKHHLIPKTLHKKLRKKKKIRREVLNRTVDVCIPCHNHIHTLFTERELSRNYNTLQLLLDDPQIQKFIKFIRKRK